MAISGSHEMPSVPKPTSCDGQRKSVHICFEEPVNQMANNNASPWVPPIIAAFVDKVMLTMPSQHPPPHPSAPSSSTPSHTRASHFPPAPDTTYPTPGRQQSACPAASHSTHPQTNPK